MTHPMRRYRKNNGFSLDAFGQLTNTSKSKLSRIENRVQDADLDFIRRVLLATGGELTAEAFLRTPPLPRPANEQLAGAA